MRAHEFDRIVGKFEMVVRESDHRRARLVVDGKVVVRTRQSQGRGDVAPDRMVAKQLGLSVLELRDAVSCTLDRNGYLALLRERDVL